MVQMSYKRCPHCGNLIATNALSRHVPVCQKLPDNDELARLYETEGWGYRRIARRYGVSDGTVRRRQAGRSRHVSPRRPRLASLRRSAGPLRPLRHPPRPGQPSEPYGPGPGGQPISSLPLVHPGSSPLPRRRGRRVFRVAHPGPAARAAPEGKLSPAPSGGLFVRRKRRWK